ncbi:glycosyltransferase, partial [Caldifermentibacillus hisashii]|uniref:glycosyltransferase n=1 Tax=Caldifermentibacillus hisashii TaxID=996558 RepID=UPI002E1FDFC6
GMGIKMKILFIVNVNNNEKGGLFYATHNRIKETIRILGKNSVKVFSINFYDNSIIASVKKILNKNINKKSKSHIQIEGINYENIYIKNTITKKLSIKFGIDKWIYNSIIKKYNFQNIDIVSAHWGSPQGSLAYYIKQKNNIPYVLTLHGSDVHTIPRFDKIFRKFLLRNMNNSDGIFFVSKQLKNEAEKLGWNDIHNKSHISYNSIDKRVFYKLSENEISLFKREENLRKYVVGFVGNLIEIKRAHFLIKIFKEIYIQGKGEITFYIIGDGPLKNRLEDEAKYEEIDVRFIKNVDQKELNIYYNLMDCLIVPSVNEGLGNVVLEAQSCGTPVIATNTGGLPEVISNKSFLVNNKDETIINEIADKVLKVLKEEIKINSRNTSWYETVGNEIKVFEEILN